MQIVFLPILIPLGTAIVLALLSKNVTIQRVVSAVSTLTTYVLSIALLFIVRGDGIQVYKQGNWDPPFGICLVADLFSSAMIVIAMTIAVAALAFTFWSIDKQREKHYLYPLFQFQLMGVNGCFLTGDLFNLFVFFEIMLIASYALISLGGEKRQLEAAVKYMAINLVGSTIMVGTVVMLYGLVGTLNMADIAQRIASSPQQGTITPIAMIFLIVFGLKGALFGLWFWMPGTYSVIPAGISAYFGGILTKVGVYCLFRVFTLMFVYDTGYTHTIILVLAGLTMLVGVLGAAAQNNYRSILTYHISSQVGYMIMGLGIFTTASVAAGMFYIVHHILVKSALFLTSGVAEKITGSQHIKSMGGLASRYPAMAVLFLVAALSLSGFPPLSGFTAKLLLIKAGFEAGGWLNYTIIAVSLLVSFFTLYSMSKIWQAAYWGKKASDKPDETNFSYKALLVPIAFLVGLCIFMGLYAEPFINFFSDAANQMMDPTVYINAVDPQSELLPN